MVLKKAILFDLDNTLIDTEAAHAVAIEKVIYQHLLVYVIFIITVTRFCCHSMYWVGPSHTMVRRGFTVHCVFDFESQL